MNLRITLTAIALSLAVCTSATAGETKTEATFTCDSSPSGECQFILYSSVCNDAPVVNGKPSLVCSLAFLQEFTLKVGEIRKLDKLPAGFKQCPVIPGKQADFPACAK